MKKNKKALLNLSKNLKRIVNSLRRYEPEKNILFGSLTKKEIDKYSDIDLVVIKESNKRFVERLVEVVEYLPKNNTIPTDIFVYTPQEFQEMQEDKNPFIEEVIKKGKIIYEKK